MAFALAIGISLGASQTGLTLTAQLVDTTGASLGSAVTTGFSEIGGGNYLWYYSAFPSDASVGVKFLSGATLKAFVSVNPADAT